MNEQEDKEKTGEEETTEDSKDGSQQETTDLIKQQGKRIEELETEKAERIKADAKKQLGGITGAGQETSKNKKKPAKEYSEAVMKGENPDRKDYE